MNEVTIIFWKNTLRQTKLPFRTELPARKGIFTRYETEVISPYGRSRHRCRPGFSVQGPPRIGLDDLAVLGIVVRLAVGPQLGHVSLLNDFDSSSGSSPISTIVPSAKSSSRSSRRPARRYPRRPEIQQPPRSSISPG